MNVNQDFVQKVVLLCLAALISGFGVPLVLKRRDETRLRQEKLIDAQSKLLDDLTQIVWKWRYLAKSVVFYGAHRDKERSNAARKEYEEKVWSVLEQFRTAISRSRRLASEAAFARLNRLYDYVVHEIDPQVSALLASDDPDAAACAHLASVFTEKVTPELDDSLDELAAEMHLKAKT